MDIDKLQKRILLMSAIHSGVRIIMWIALGWLGVEAILHIGEHGLNNLIDVIWLGE